MSVNIIALSWYCSITQWFRLWYQGNKLQFMGCLTTNKLCTIVFISQQIQLDQTHTIIILYCIHLSQEQLMVVILILELRADEPHNFGPVPHHQFNEMSRHHPFHESSMSMIERSLNPLTTSNGHPVLTSHIAELEHLRRATSVQSNGERGIPAVPHPTQNFPPTLSGKQFFHSN